MLIVQKKGLMFQNVAVYFMFWFDVPLMHKEKLCVQNTNDKRGNTHITCASTCKTNPNR